MSHPSHSEKARIWVTRFRRNYKEVLKNTLVSGLAIFIFSYGGLLAMIQVFPDLFVAYISPVFNSDGSRDVYFYLHPFILALSLSVFWNRFRKMFEGNVLQIGIEFSVVYTFIALVPIMWITYATMDVPLSMVVTWLVYGLFQSAIAGFFLAWFSPWEGHTS